MPPESRQQRRKTQRERVKTGERNLARGMPTSPAREDVVAIAEVVRAKLAESGNAQRASQAAGLAQALAERSLKAHPPRIEIACRKGCAYCCHLMVAVTAPEAFRIAALIRKGVPGLDATTVKAKAKPLIGVAHPARVGAKLACPLLVDGDCGVYDVRPLTCRQTTSRSLDACIDEFEGRDRTGSIEASSVHLAHASNAHVILLGAMRAAGLSTTAYELAAALDAILESPDAEARWLAGEDVLASVPPAPPRPREVELIAARIAEELER